MDAQECSSRARLDGRVALVTGASRNIGRAIAERFAIAGADVAVTGRADSQELESTVESIESHGVRAFAVLADLGDLGAIDGLVSDVESRLGPVDVLVNNAGVRPRVPFEKITHENWSNVLNVNLAAPFFLAQRVVSGMLARQWGRIINISGIDAVAGSEKRAHVSVAKGGMITLSRVLAMEYATAGIRVNTVVPGPIDTVRDHPEWYGNLEELYQNWSVRLPMRRVGTSQEVADVALFLACEMSSYMTGQEVYVSGGYPRMYVPRPASGD